MRNVDWRRRDLLSVFGAAAAPATLSALGPIAPAAAADDGPSLCLQDDRPGDESALLQTGYPIGNGRLGALWGEPPSRACLSVTDGGLWSGGRNATLDAEGQFPYGERDLGTLMMLAGLHWGLSGHDFASISNYRRSLDLATGCAVQTYELGGVTYRQTLFASHPDDVLVVSLACSPGGRLSGRVTLSGTRGEPVDGLAMPGSLANGLRFAAAVRVAHEGGRVAADGDALAFSDCRALVIAFAGHTDRGPDLASNYRVPGLDPLGLATERAARAVAVGGARLLARHVADHRRLFGGFSVDLGRSTAEQRAMTTGDRLAARARPDAAPDPELEALYLQFGRYLTIAGSRGGWPAGLQGPWLADNRPPWFADYHSDINIEMNYWLADRAGLSECARPFSRYCLSQYPSWTDLTRRLFNDPRNRFRNRSGKIAGWTVAISLNLDGGMGWWWHPAGNAWLCNNLWQHYEYTRDRGHLEAIYPMLRYAVAFWEARLVTVTVRDAAGAKRQVLVDDHDWSPEHGPDQARGISYAQELVRDLFTNYASAATALGRDAGQVARTRAMLDRLYVPAISPVTGALEEWMSRADLGEPEHRHLSPLVGLFPGDSISVDRSPPELITAARRLLAARGMRSNGWANAWRAACWARLKDGEKAHQLIGTTLAPVSDRSGTSPNLFNTDFDPDGDDAGPGRRIFQIDGNLGMPAAMLEMLLYSCEGRIEALPRSRGRGRRAARSPAWARAAALRSISPGGTGARPGWCCAARPAAGRSCSPMAARTRSRSRRVARRGSSSCAQKPSVRPLWSATR